MTENTTQILAQTRIRVLQASGALSRHVCMLEVSSSRTWVSQGSRHTRVQSSLRVALSVTVHLSATDKDSLNPHQLGDGQGNAEAQVLCTVQLHLASIHPVRQYGVVQQQACNCLRGASSQKSFTDCESSCAKPFRGCKDYLQISLWISTGRM